MGLPALMIDPHRAWSEVPSKIQSSQDTTRPIASLALYAAYLLSGTPLTGPAEDIPPEVLAQKFEEGCFDYDLDPARVLRWAESINMGYADMAQGVEDAVPRRLDFKKITLRPYQHATACWSASRMGTIEALSCGVGKTATSTASAIGAVRLGRCSNERCYIFAPLNALGTWDSYCDDLRTVFKDVKILSMDSAHKVKGLQRNLGGALILDEIHNLKNDSARRSMALMEIRAAFEWCVGLTGTLLHAGPEGILQLQDLVLPGSCRFFDKWAFGDAFKCVIDVTFGDGARKRTKKKLVIPPAEQQGPFCTYMARVVKSLTEVSPEVADTLKLPGHTSIPVDTWEEPTWIRELRTKHMDANEENRVFWYGNLTGRESRLFVGAFTLALADQIANTGSIDPDTEDEEPTPEELAFAGFDSNALPDPSEGPELPSLSLVLSALRREGLYDRCVVKTAKKDGFPDYKFVYRDGITDPLNLPFGPKLQFVLDWLRDNPDEPLVVAAYHKETIFRLSSEFEKLGIEHRLIRGSVSKKNRVEYIKEFQDGKVRVMLMQQRAGSESIELTRAANSMLIEHAWIPAIYTQFMARTYRGGQERPCNHYDMAFGEFQRDMLKRLIRGQGFDASVRAQLENMWNFQATVLDAKNGIESV